MVWLAYGLLACGHAHGGAAQRAALEMRRLDVADGALTRTLTLTLTLTRTLTRTRTRTLTRYGFYCLVLRPALVRVDPSPNPD